MSQKLSCECLEYNKNNRQTNTGKIRSNNNTNRTEVIQSHVCLYRLIRIDRISYFIACDTMHN